jgi:hypothetical protein
MYKFKKGDLVTPKAEIGPGYPKPGERVIITQIRSNMLYFGDENRNFYFYAGEVEPAKTKELF